MEYKVVRPMRGSALLTKVMPLVSSLVLALSSVIAQTDAPSSPHLVTVGQRVSAAATDPLEILRSFQTYYIKSGTIYLHRDVLQKELEQRPEFTAWHLKPSDDPASADLTVEITLPFMSWEWNYKLVERATGRLLATGKVKALDQHQAAPLLAAEITKTIQSVRGLPEMQGLAVAQPTHAQAAQKKWHVKGASGPLLDKDLVLSIGRESISVSEQSGQGLEIPTRSVLSAYHTSFADSAERSRQRRQDWDAGWTKVCDKTMGSEGCLAIVGAPIWLIGDAILTISGPSTHFVVVRWQDDQDVNEVCFRVGVFEWRNILKNFQAAVPSDALPVTGDTQDLRKEFDAATQKALKVSLGSTVSVGRWPPLESGDYRIVVVARALARAEVFFFRLGETQFDRPQAVAAAHLTRVPQSASPPTVTFREKDGVRLLDEIRGDDLLLCFD
jgi:hypothetical protein